MTNEENEIADIIADAAPLPLLDAAYALWRRRCRLDTLEGRPTAEEVRINRTLTPEQFSAKYRWDRHHARDGPAFSHLKRAHPRADDGAIKQAIMTAVKFEDACFKNFEQGAGEYWQRCEHAVARARRDFPGFHEDTTGRPPTTSPIITNSARRETQKQSVDTTPPRLSLMT